MRTFLRLPSRKDNARSLLARAPGSNELPSRLEVTERRAALATWTTAGAKGAQSAVRDTPPVSPLGRPPHTAEASSQWDGPRAPGHWACDPPSPAGASVPMVSG